MGERGEAEERERGCERGKGGGRGEKQREMCLGGLTKKGITEWEVHRNHSFDNIPHNMYVYTKLESS